MSHARLLRLSIALAAVLAAVWIVQSRTWEAHCRRRGTDLIAATERADLRRMNALLDQGVPVDWRGSWGQTALGQAAMKANPILVRLLLERGANPDGTGVVTLGGHCVARASALHWAVAAGDLKLTKTLLDHGANINIPGDEEDFVHPNVAVYLKTNGYEMSDAEDLKAMGWRSPPGRGTALMLAVDDGNSALGKLLLNHGASPNARNRRGQTALMRTLETSEWTVYESVRPLFRQDGPLAVEGGARARELLRAALLGNDASVEALLKQGADPNAREKDGMTALMAAAATARIGKVRALLAAGADVNARTTGGWTALLYAARTTSSSVLVPPLLEAGADVDARDGYGRTALIHLADLPYGDVLAKLVKADANVHARDEAGETALMKAAAFFPWHVNTLLNAGAHVNAPDPEGQTPLMRAAHSGEPHCVKVLLDWGADINARDHQGRTALSLATDTTSHAIPEYLAELRRESIALLKKAGARPNR
jgi:uncharacterized protein